LPDRLEDGAAEAIRRFRSQPDQKANQKRELERSRLVESADAKAGASRRGTADSATGVGRRRKPKVYG
jgi:hypothetical protein